MHALAHDSMQGRLTGTIGLQKAAGYIAGEMEKIGLIKMAGVDNGYLIPWERKERKKMYGAENVIGIISGGSKQDTLIIFSAHYDHLGVLSAQKALPFRTGFRRVKGDTIFNGANDNATGVAAMLELARVYAQSKPDYTLMFVAFSGEELGLWGSAAFAAKFDNKVVKLNINLEMLGRPLGEKPFVTEPEEGSEFRDLLNYHLSSNSSDYPKSFFTIDPYPEQRLFERSDNISFYKNGIPAYTIMASNPRDEFYHSSADHAATIQFDEMTRIVQAIAIAVGPIIKR